MKAIAIGLLMLILGSSGYGQQTPYGYRLVGQRGIVSYASYEGVLIGVSNAILVRDGSLLDSAVNVIGTKETAYRFKYNGQGKLVSDSNFTRRVIHYVDSLHRIHSIYQPYRRQYIYDERGAVDSIAYAYWTDSVWIAESWGWKFFYSNDGKLISSRFLYPVDQQYNQLFHTYTYDGAGNLVADTLFSGTRPDTSYTCRQYDQQNRLTLLRSSDDPSGGYARTVYEYDSSGNAHVTKWYLNSNGDTTGGNDSYLTFDASGRLIMGRTSRWDPDASKWWPDPSSDLTGAYDSKGRFLTCGLGYLRYADDGNLDSLWCPHPVYGFIGAHFVDSYGNDITLPDYLGMTRLYYHPLVTSVEKQGGPPLAFALSQNYPNPFNPSTLIRFSVPSRSFVTLSIYNVLGQKIGDLVNGELAPGEHTVRFDAARLPSGVYFYRLSAGAFVETRRMIVLR